MVDFFQDLDREQLEKLLNFNVRMDELLDEAMTNKQSLEDQIKILLNLVVDEIKKLEYERPEIKVKSAHMLYFDYLMDPVVLSIPEGAGENTQLFLERAGVRRNPCSNRLEADPTSLQERIQLFQKGGIDFPSSYLIENLEVNGNFIGYVFLEIDNPIPYCRILLNRFAIKIDTDIYAHNNLMLESEKNSGIKFIDGVFDSDHTLETKYKMVLERIVKSVRGFCGYLVIPKETHLDIAAQYINSFNGECPDSSAILKTAQNITIRNGSEGVAHEKEFRCASEGNLYSLILNPKGDNVEGILFVYHPCFNDNHIQLVKALSSLLDSSLHTDRLYSQIFKNFIHTLGQVIDTFDTYTSGHSYRVSQYALALGKAVGLNQLELTKLHIASILHDIGKVGVNPNIIRKNCRLSDEERHEVEEHALHSGHILEGVFPNDLNDIYTLAMSHHEKEDGTGYPRQLKSEEIPQLSKIICVADIFDALTSDRPYHRGRTREQAYEILLSDASKNKISMTLVKRFMQDDVWRMIRKEFFKMKVVSAGQWFKKNMLPNIYGLEKEQKSIEECLEDLSRMEAKYKDTGEITLDELVESLLFPGDKDRLIQREHQKNPDYFLTIIKDIKKKYQNRRDLAKDKIEFELKFIDDYWDWDLFNSIENIFISLVEKDFDLLLPIEKLLPNTTEDSVIKPDMPLLHCLRAKFDQAEKLKGLNDEYKAPLEEAKQFAFKILENAADKACV